ncbi:MAG: T9SS type A sorting domain-containing protein, partial [Bacteroidia bacterium]|nr:T9SS type A sorting domain-containing protein [Bacteroidia bacterium]
RHKVYYSNIYFQHVDANGNLKWPVNGLAVSPENVGYDRVEPRIRYDQGTGELFLFWAEYRAVGAYDSFGMLGQKAGQDGSLKWGDLGKIFTGFTMDTIWYINAVKPIPDHDILILVDQEYDSIILPDTVQFDQLFAMRIDSAGTLVWSPQHVLMAATQGPKYYPDMSDLSDDIFVASWNENRDSPYDPDGSVYAQNISLAGKLGPLGIPILQGQESILFIYPNPTQQTSWLEFREPVSGVVEVDVINQFGQRMKSIRITMDDSNPTIRLDAGQIPSGLYLIRARYNKKENLVKWLVLK